MEEEINRYLNQIDQKIAIIDNFLEEVDIEDKFLITYLLHKGYFVGLNPIELNSQYNIKFKIGDKIKVKLPKDSPSLSWNGKEGVISNIIFGLISSEECKILPPKYNIKIPECEYDRMINDDKHIELI